MAQQKNVAAIAASLLSRGAASDLSHGRKPVGGVVWETEPRRGERVRGICRTYGAYIIRSRKPRASFRLRAIALALRSPVAMV
jgi:hypothetical protein